MPFSPRAADPAELEARQAEADAEAEELARPSSSYEVLRGKNGELLGTRQSSWNARPEHVARKHATTSEPHPPERPPARALASAPPEFSRPPATAPFSAAPAPATPTGFPAPSDETTTVTLPTP